MSEKTILRVLRDFRLTETESEVYIFLVKSGIQKARDISSSLKMHKAQVYRILKDLEKRGMVEQTLESPSRFTAISFEKLLDVIIRGKREEANSLEDMKDDLMVYLRSIVVDEPSTLTEKVMVLEGRSNVYSRILELLEETEKEFLLLTTELGVIRGDLAGLFEAAITKATEKQNVYGRILTPVTNNNFKIIQQIVDKASINNINFEWRHVNLVSKLFPRFIIKDEEEVLSFISPKEDLSIDNKEDTGLWTNSKAFVYAQKAFFDELWNSAIDVDERVREIEEID